LAPGGLTRILSTTDLVIKASDQVASLALEKSRGLGWSIGVASDLVVGGARLLVAVKNYYSCFGIKRPIRNQMLGGF
jgi:hypothetical protein